MYFDLPEIVGDYKLTFKQHCLEQMTLKDFEDALLIEYGKQSLEELYYKVKDLECCDIAIYESKENQKNPFRLCLSIAFDEMAEKEADNSSGVVFYAHESNTDILYTIAFVPTYEWGIINEKLKELILKKPLVEWVFGGDEVGRNE